MRNLCFYLVIFSFLFGCKPENNKAPRLPNIILVMADDQGWGDMAYNGHPIIQTPYFDTMASETLRFDRFYAAAPVCSPTRGSVLTGRHPNRFACFTWGRTLRPQEITIAELLKSAGYVTGHFGKWHLGSVRQGSPVNPGASGFDEWLSAPNFFDNNPILSREGVAVQTEGESSMVIVDAALKFIQKHEAGDQPYLAVVWFGSPHLPHEALEQDQQLYADQPPGLQQFYGEITAMDRAFGKLRTTLKSLESNDNTILWYLSDNGALPEIGASGGRGHKAKIYEGGLLVPSMLEWPAKIHQARVTSFPANTSDIFPTLAEIVGLPLDENRPMDGISLIPLIDNQMNTRSQAMGFWNYPASGVRTPSAEWMAELLEAQKQGNIIGDSARLRLDDILINTQYSYDSLPGHAAWLDWPWKLHRIEDQTSNIAWELYNLEKDPFEEENIVDSHPERIADMKAPLEDWQRSVVGSLNGLDY